MKSNFERQKPISFLQKHYHWIVAATILLMIFIYGGLNNNLQALHLIPLTEYLSISRADFSFAFLFQTLTSVLSTFFSGFVISRFGCRIPATIALVLVASSYFVLSRIETYPTLIFCGAIMGFALGFCSTAGATLTIRAWFRRHVGAVLGLVTAASGIGASVMAAIQTAAMEAGSFRTSFQFASIALFSCAILVFFLLRNKPEEKGLAPLGEGEEIIRKRKRIADDAFPGHSFKKLCTRPSFYFMFFTTFLSCFGLYLAYALIRSHFVDCGFSATRASAFFSTMMLLLTGSKFLVGALSDRLGARVINLVCLLCGAVSLVLLAFTKTAFVATLSMIFYAIALPTVTIMSPLLSYSLFGYRAQAQYTGIFLAIGSISSFLGTYVSNFIHDIFGSYQPSFLIGAGLCILSIGLFLVLYKMANKERLLSEQDSAPQEP